MNQDKYLLIERDGYPAQIETLQTLNDASQQALTSIAAVCGSNTILKGCVDEVREGITYVTDGIMCIDGRIFQFKGGFKTQGVTVITEKVEDVYDTGDGSVKQMLPVRAFSYVTNSPQGVGSVLWDSFVRVADLKELTELIPKVTSVYESRILAKGIQIHSFAKTVESTSYPHIKINFPSPLYDNDYVIQLSAEILIKDNVGIDLMTLNSFEHTKEGFKVKAGRALTGNEITFNIHWIVFKK